MSGIVHVSGQMRRLPFALVGFGHGGRRGEGSCIGVAVGGAAEERAETETRSSAGIRVGIVCGSQDKSAGEAPGNSRPVGRAGANVHFMIYRRDLDPTPATLLKSECLRCTRHGKATKSVESRLSVANNGESNVLGSVCCPVVEGDVQPPTRHANSVVREPSATQSWKLRLNNLDERCLEWHLT